MKNLDKQAYDIVCNWAKEIDFNPIFDGIDYSQIIRFYLWDKVGRAIRIQNKTSYNEVESYVKDYKSYPFYYTPQKSKGKYKKIFFNRKKLIFIPFQTSHTGKLIESLLCNKKYTIISKQITKQIQPKNVIKPQLYEYKLDLPEVLFKAVIKALYKLKVTLIKEDIELLKLQIEGTVKITALAEKELKKYKPNAVYVHSDNHPPFINYVLVAKKLKIPTFTYQHGLDCEHYFLDDCYADHVAVWSKNRKERYIKDSVFQPKNYSIVGNVLLPKSTLNLNLDNTIVFVTRPHKSIKCYSTSRNCFEGLEILSVILDVLINNPTVSLILKCHPMDYKQEYEQLIKEKDLEHRVEISDSKLINVFKRASIVITEDTTAGAEAIYYGIPCVHAHLSSSEPVLPFVKYGCALPGFSKKELASNITKALLDTDNLELLKMSQQKFINDFLPEGDIDKLVAYISENI